MGENFRAGARRQGDQETQKARKSLHAKRKKPNKVVEAPDFTAEPTDIPLDLTIRDPFKYPKTLPRLYLYRPLDSGRNEIRLLQLPPLQEPQTISNAIEATLVHVALDESPEYEALPYRWSALLVNP
jgi:hypothetical protein